MKTSFLAILQQENKMVERYNLLQDHIDICKEHNMPCLDKVEHGKLENDIQEIRKEIAQLLRSYL